jgi:hypothetical protein
MGTPAGGALRVFRTVAITAVIVGLAVTAHVAGGDRAPRPLGVAGLALVTAYACAWLSRRRLSPVAVTALVGAGQWLLHHAFDLLQAPVCTPVGAGAGHAGHVRVTGGCLGETGGTGALATAHGAASGPVLAAHAVATLATALILAGGERALWALCALLAALLPVVPRPATPTLPAAPRMPDTSPRPLPRRAVLLRASRRRGPPTAAPRPLARLAF